MAITMIVIVAVILIQKHWVCSYAVENTGKVNIIDIRVSSIV